MADLIERLEKEASSADDALHVGCASVIREAIDGLKTAAKDKKSDDAAFDEVNRLLHQTIDDRDRWKEIALSYQDGRSPTETKQDSGE